MSVEEEKNLATLSAIEVQDLDEEKLRSLLGDLPEFDYLKQRKDIAAKLGFPVGDLDKFRANPQTENKTRGRAVELYEPEPWTEPVNGAEVLSDAADTITKHMVIRQVDADACALWAAHTHIYDIFNHTPRLLVTAPDAECGKTLLMVHMVGDMCPRMKAFELMKPAPFFRLAELYKPVFLIDEADIFLNTDADILASVNSGWEPHGSVARCDGDDHEVCEHSTHCPVVLAGVEMHKHLKNTTIGRSIVIKLDRAGYEELLTIIKYKPKQHRKDILNIGRKLARWCIDNKQKIAKCDPEIPAGIGNREEDKWIPLLAIADIAGGDWPERARAAMLNQTSIGEQERAIQLISDTYKIIGDDKGIFTRDLIPALCALEGRPWKDYNFNQYEESMKRITDKQIGRLLGRYGVEHGNLRDGNVQLKGYTRKAIKAVYDRYIPKSTGTKQQETSPEVVDIGNKGGRRGESSVPPSQKGAKAATETGTDSEWDGGTGNLPPESPAVPGVTYEMDTSFLK